MPGTIEGGRAAAHQNKTKYGKDFYVKIGAVGGKWSGRKGFAVNRQAARVCGAYGGSLSSRSGRKKTPQERARLRREFEQAYARLQKIHDKADQQRKAVVQSA